MNILEQREAAYEACRWRIEQVEKLALELGLVKINNAWWQFWKPVYIWPDETAPPKVSNVGGNVNE